MDDQEVFWTSYIGLGVICTICGALFTIWDRLFGTYVAPDANKPKTFGTGEKQRDPVLLMIGISAPVPRWTVG